MALDPTVFVHEHGLCESEQVGRRTRIWAFAHVLAGARIGEDCNICDHAFVEGAVLIGDRVTVKNAVLLFDGVTVGDEVFLGPGVVFTNDLRPRAAIRKGTDELVATTVRRGATIGANATVVCGVTIGEHAFVAAGSVVTRDVPAHALVAGSPARLIGWVCSCGERLDDDLSCNCGLRHDKAGDGPGLVVLPSGRRPGRTRSRTAPRV